MEKLLWKCAGEGEQLMPAGGGRVLASPPAAHLDSGMGATLIESPDEHHWVLLEHQVTQLVIEASSFRIQTWSLEGSAEIRCAAPFILRQASGIERTIDPTETETLAPLLPLLRRRVESLTITRDGELTIAFSGGTSVVVTSGRRTAGWEVQGGGALEGMSYAGALPQPHGHE